MIDVVRDREGVRMALEEIFEQDYTRALLRRQLEGANAETLANLESRVPPRTLSPGYYSFADHLLRLEAEQKAGIALEARDAADFEVAGLLALGSARAAFEANHPECTRCGARQSSRFGVSCHRCGAKFERKGK
ncbi:MAG: hypothetical protein P4K83_02085 [Terracidiphilus sp.]|nr:hypothetical protein [Terracidiphilus sp.]